MMGERDYTYNSLPALNQASCFGCLKRLNLGFANLSDRGCHCALGQMLARPCIQLHEPGHARRYVPVFSQSQVSKWSRGLTSGALPEARSGTPPWGRVDHLRGTALFTRSILVLHNQRSSSTGVVHHVGSLVSKSSSASVVCCAILQGSLTIQSLSRANTTSEQISNFVPILLESITLSQTDDGVCR